ncbi:MAG: hypothetical protein N2439_09930, partial [Anaerolineae bacterium]|nr:hypothetical protein [Anaerolineae bacterium]
MEAEPDPGPSAITCGSTLSSQPPESTYHTYIRECMLTMARRTKEEAEQTRRAILELSLIHI